VCRKDGPGGTGVDAWFAHVWQLRFLMRYGGVQLRMDDLSPLEWWSVAWANHQVEIEENRPLEQAAAGVDDGEST
jgi:hypothetical protein